MTSAATLQSGDVRVSWPQRLALIAAGTLVGLALVEVVLRLGSPVPSVFALPENRYIPSRYAANMSEVLSPDPANLPGTRRPIRFTTNALGFRSRRPMTAVKPPGTRRIVFIGG